LETKPAIAASEGLATDHGNNLSSSWQAWPRKLLRPGQCFEGRASNLDGAPALPRLEATTLQSRFVRESRDRCCSHNGSVSKAYRLATRQHRDDGNQTQGRCDTVNSHQFARLGKALERDRSEARMKH